MFGVFKKVKFFCLLFLSLHNFVASSQVKDVGGFTTITIGNQVWMQYNLRELTFRNGDSIFHAKSDEEWERAGIDKVPAWCWYNNDMSKELHYGVLYNWYAVNDSRGLAPLGYHIPSDFEWSILTDYLGGEEKAEKKIKSPTNLWIVVEKNLNSSGFSATPAGLRGMDGVFSGDGEQTRFWCSTELGNGYNAFYRSLLSRPSKKTDKYMVYRGTGNLEAGFSVRCIKD